MDTRKEESIALEAIRKKLIGKKLSYKEIYAVMDEIAHDRLGDVLTTYFAASGYSKGFSNEELYFLTRAMVETGEQLSWHKKIVADKHSIGGIPGTRTTMIVIPIVAAAGFLIPKSSSRAITTPDGTADDMEILARVEFERQEIYNIVGKTNGCIVWGGSFRIAPADDILIHVESPLSFESYDKIVVSIMAKKVAFGSSHVVIDIPYGKSMKVSTKTDAEILEKKFIYIAKRFGIFLDTYVHHMRQPSGRGIGTVLETKDALEVLEQLPQRPQDLEEHAITLATLLLDLCLKDSSKELEEKIQHEYGSTKMWATYLLTSGQALAKMKEIIQAQHGDPTITSDRLMDIIGKIIYEVKAEKSGEVKEIDSHNLTKITKILAEKGKHGAGIYLNKKIGELCKKGDTLYTLYSSNMYTMREAVHSLDHFPIMEL